MQPFRRGDTGQAVVEIRGMLATIGLLNNTDPELAGQFDEATELAVRHFQQKRGISVTGAVGEETYVALRGAHWALGDRTLAHDSGQPMTGTDVTSLQTQLIELGYHLTRADGVFEAATATALRSFQRDYGLVPDGICGPKTFRSLLQLGRRVVGGRPVWLRDTAAVADAGPSLLTKRIMLDAGHGGADRGVLVDHRVVDNGIEQVAEADLAWDIVSRLEGRLAALGVQTWLTHGPHYGATDAERAQRANAVSADLLLSVHIDGFASPRANGVASYYFGAGESSSTIGERLADLAQRELVARTGMRDNRIHGKTWEILRLTRMTAVRVECGYLTSPRDRSLLIQPRFRDLVAEGLLVAIQRLYLPQADDVATGVMKIPAVAS